MSEELRAAVAAGALGAEAMHTALLQSIVDVARSIFGARAASIMLHDQEASELVFAAVSGEGAEEAVDRRLPSGTGVAGWVLATHQPVVIENVRADPRFAGDVATSTGYVPNGLMAVPLLLGERILGVLSVLDRPERSQFTLPEMELLGGFAVQAALALELVARARTAQRVLDEGPSELANLAGLAAALGQVDEERREAAHALIGALRDLVS